MSNNINEVRGFNWQMALALFTAWALTAACLIRGVKSSGKASNILHINIIIKVCRLDIHKIR